MPTRLTIHFRGVGDAMRGPGVRHAIDQEAGRIANRARAINTSEQIDATVAVEAGTNARTSRPYSRVTSTAVAAEFGTSRTARRRVLGRAAEQGS